MGSRYTRLDLDNSYINFFAAGNPNFISNKESQGRIKSQYLSISIVTIYYSKIWRETIGDELNIDQKSLEVYCKLVFKENE